MENRCKVQKSNGERCKANAQRGKSICIFHDPSKAADGARARRAGGVNRNRPLTVLCTETVQNPLNNAKDVARLLAESIHHVLTGMLDPKVANAVGYLASIVLRAVEQGPLEERLGKIEETLAAMGGHGRPTETTVQWA